MSDERPDVFDLVLTDFARRNEVGLVEYGVTMQPHDGRDSLWDAYEEALDLAVYLRKLIWERDHPRD